MRSKFIYIILIVLVFVPNSIFGQIELPINFENEQITNKYPHRKIQIEVSEDGENGCNITYPTK